MSETNINKWRNSFTLISNNASVPGKCKKGQTFRGGVARNTSVEFGSRSKGTGCDDINKFASAKPGPTTQFDSSLARRRKIQVRTTSIKTGNSESDNKFNRTFRGNNPHVENGRDGFAIGARAQLFGIVSNDGNQKPVNVKGVRGDSSDVIYFKPIFERLKLNVKN